MIRPSLGGKPLSLRAGEALVWRGHPVQGLLRNPAHIGWGLALIAFGGWLIFGGAPRRVYTGGIFIFIGIYLGYFQAIVEKNRRAGTYYALTNQRALLAYGGRVLAFPIRPTSRIKLRKRRYDTLFFTVDPHPGMPQGSRVRQEAFGHLENGDDVYNRMLDVQKNLTSKGQ